MKKLKLLTLLFVSLVFTLQSCKDNFTDDFSGKNVSPDIQVVNGRLAFKNSQVLYKTISQLNRAKSSEVKKWLDNYKFSSAFKSIDTVGVDSLSYNGLPNGYQAVINAKGEVVFGDTILWYGKDGKQYFVPKLNEQELTKIKFGDTAGKLSKGFLVSTPAIKSKGNALNNGKEQTVTFTGAAPLSYQFDYDGWRKQWVDELYTVYDYNINVSTLYIRFRLESQHVTWWGHHYWTADVLDRTIFYDIQGSGDLEWSATYGTHTFAVADSFDNNTWQTVVYLTEDDIDPYEPQFKDWDVSVNAYINHWVDDAPTETDWINSGVIW